MLLHMLELEKTRVWVRGETETVAGRVVRRYAYERNPEGLRG